MAEIFLVLAEVWTLGYPMEELPYEFLCIFILFGFPFSFPGFTVFMFLNR